MTSEKLKKLKSAYMTQKRHAKERNIPFLLTFEQWLDLWDQSGHLHERGRGKGKYVMARLGPDIGPYEVENVVIQLGTQNASDASKGRTPSKTTKAKQSAAAKGRISRGGYGNKGKIHTNEHTSKRTHSVLRAKNYKKFDWVI